LLPSTAKPMRAKFCAADTAGSQFCLTTSLVKTGLMYFDLQQKRREWKSWVKYEAGGTNPSSFLTYLFFCGIFTLRLRLLFLA